MTERKLIQCPVCHGSTKEIQGVLCCIANCRVQFWGLSQDKWYVGTEEELEAANAKIAELTSKLEAVSNLHLFSILRPGTKVLDEDITDAMSDAYYSAGETPDDAWRAMWKAADSEVYVNPVTNKILKRCIQISFERGFQKAVTTPQTLWSSRKTEASEIGAVIHLALEELLRQNPDMFKGLTEEQFY